jgi:hypothetical protein
MNPVESKTQKPPVDHAISRLRYATSKLIVVDLYSWSIPEEHGKREEAQHCALRRDGLECPREVSNSCSARIAALSVLDQRPIYVQVDLLLSLSS